MCTGRMSSTKGCLQGERGFLEMREERSQRLDNRNDFWRDPIFRICSYAFLVCMYIHIYIFLHVFIFSYIFPYAFNVFKHLPCFPNVHILLLFSNMFLYFLMSWGDWRGFREGFGEVFWKYLESNLRVLRGSITYRKHVQHIKNQYTFDTLIHVLIFPIFSYVRACFLCWAYVFHAFSKFSYIFRSDAIGATASILV